MFRTSFRRRFVAVTTGIQPESPPLSPEAAPGVRALDSETSPELRDFDFEELVSKFEAVTFPPSAAGHATLPCTAPFLDAMDEVLLLFDYLGNAFGFVKRDIAFKIGILRAYAADNPAKFDDLATAVQAEIDAGTVDAKPPPSAARTLLRLMWALKFINVLLNHLRVAFETHSALPEDQRTLKSAVSTAYDEALSDHHSWALRRAVRAALRLLPTKEAFMARLSVDKLTRDEFLDRLENSMTPLTKVMYAFYEEHNLLDLQ